MEITGKIDTERAATVGIITYDNPEDEVNASLDELERLLETAGGRAVIRLVQSKENPDVRTFLGSGKMKELAELCRGNDVTLVVCDSELSPSQIRNMEDILDSGDPERPIRVIDRSMLILDIFALHATSAEGKLQVELAQLKYTAPRLIGKGIEMSRQGGTSGSIGARGPGETKLETDRRHIKRRIAALEDELREMENDREVKRKKRVRSGIPCVAIAGYTNAGKSTLLNRLTDAGILAEDKLFATLDPTIRKLTLPSGREVLLSDTVGFIDNLPHKLVEAFRSTLDEVRYADALIIVTDAADPEAEKKLAVTEETINELSAGGKPTLYVFNKCDGLDILPLGGDDAALAEHHAVCISAKTGYGTEKLLAAVEDMLASLTKKAVFLIPFSAHNAVNTLYKSATVLSTEYLNDGTKVEALVDDKTLGRFRDYLCEE